METAAREEIKLLHNSPGRTAAEQRIETTSANITQDTNGELRPTYEVIQRPVGYLACGDLVVEPVLGEVRVVQVTEFGYDEVRGQRQLQVHWAADDGLSTAARLFPAEAMVGVRVPALVDRQAIRRGIDLAAYHRREIDAGTARTIAAQLQRGPGSALYAFAVSGAISDRLYDELEEAALSRAPTVKRWVNALARYCLGREDQGSVEGWAKEGW
jgi:hypothetical protein